MCVVAVSSACGERRRAVAQAVLGRAQVRAALEHPARDARARFGGCRGEQVRPRARVDRHLAGHLVPRRVEVGRPLPHVAGDVVEPIAVRRERHDGRRADPALGARVVVGEPPLPLVHHEASAGRSSSPHANRAPSRPPRAAYSSSARWAGACPPTRRRPWHPRSSPAPPDGSACRRPTTRVRTDAASSRPRPSATTAASRAGRRDRRSA